MRAFLSGPDGMVDLNSLLDATGAGWTLTLANGLSENGFITGEGRINGESHAFLLTANPVPEPASMAALGFGALGLVKRRKRLSVP